MNGSRLRLLVSDRHKSRREETASRSRNAVLRTISNTALGVLAALLLGISTISTTSASAQQFTFRHYAHEDGLRNLDVFQVIQDRSGKLWAATENGVFAYDGSGFQRLGASDGLAENMFLGVTQDPSGRIWVTSNDHLYYSSGKKFYEVPAAADTLQIRTGQYLAGLDAEHTLFVSHSTLLVATLSSASKHWSIAPFLGTEETTEHPELTQIKSVFVDRAGTIWLGCGERICRVERGAKGRTVSVLDQHSGVPATFWKTIYEDRAGTIWIRSDAHIAVLQPGTTSFRSRDITPQSESTFVGAGIVTFGEDKFGNVLTQSSTGIARWDGTGWTIFNRDNGLDFSDISSILLDRQGSLWFSTRGHGLERWLGYGEIESWTTAQGLANDIVWYVSRDRRDRVWIADHLAVSLLDDKRKSIQKLPQLISQRTPIQQIDGIEQTPAGAVWMTSLSGHVLHAKPGTEKFADIAQLPDIVRMFQDASHRIWICTRDGLYLVKDPDARPVPDEALNTFPGPDVIGSDAFADAAQSPNGDLWFVSEHHLYRLKDNRWAQVPVEAFTANGQIRSIAVASDGTLWLGGGLASLYHLRVDGDQATLLGAVSVPEVASSDVQFVRFDQRGWLWIGTDVGVNVFDGTRWMLLTRLDGLLSGDTNEGAFYADPDGSVWIGVNGGASHLLHPAHLFAHDSLHVNLSSARLGDRDLALNSSTEGLHWQNAPLDVTFTSPDYDREGALSFRYRLFGLEKEWNQTTGHHVHYPAMPPGRYRFEVQLVDEDLRQHSPLASFSLQIQPPWWNTRIFDLVLATLALCIFLLMLRLRERHLIRKQLILSQLVAQRTAELEAEKVELVAAREALRLQATQDAHTGLWNRAFILDVLTREMTRAHREKKELAVVLLDLDHFKRINDTHGHLVGDSVLREAARRMMENTRSYDFIGRYGGEEFLLIMPTHSRTEPLNRLTRILEAFAQRPFECNGLSLHVTCSMGVAWVDEQTRGIEDVIQLADDALYRAKRAGRNRIEYDQNPLQLRLPDGVSELKHR